MASPVPVNADPFGRRVGEPRKDLVAGTVTATEKSNIVDALAAAGFESQSDGVRSVCLAYLKSPEIRGLVDQLRNAGHLA